MRRGLRGTPTEFAPRAAPSISAVDPASGPEAGGTEITVTGTGFRSGCTVTVDGEPATDVVRNSSTEIVCVTPAGEGAVDVVVTNTDGEDSGDDGVEAFTYVAPD